MILDKRLHPGTFIEVGKGFVLTRSLIREKTPLSIGDEISNELSLLRVFWLCIGTNRLLLRSAKTLFGAQCRKLSAVIH
jgi:hypothetical protein